MFTQTALQENTDSKRVVNTDSMQTIVSKNDAETTIKKDTRNVQSPTDDSGSTTTHVTIRWKGLNNKISLSNRKKEGAALGMGR